jgi:Mn2+/Fe2+ NRAMP family transporter
MGILLTVIAGLVVWIVLWAIGVKSFDAFLIPMTLVLLAATARMFTARRQGSGSNWNPR